MKKPTAQLVGAALDWAVDKAMGEREANDPDKHDDWDLLPYSTDWDYGGPIIEREWIEWCVHDNETGVWKAWPYWDIGAERLGPTPLIAAMRCYVASKLGDEVDVPEELL